MTSNLILLNSYLDKEKFASHAPYMVSSRHNPQPTGKTCAYCAPCVVS